MIRVVLICFLAMVAAGQVKRSDGTLHMLISSAACLYLLFYSLAKLSGVLGVISGIFEQLSVDKVYFEILLKIAGIAYVGEMGTALCKDAGYHAMGEQISVAAKFTVLGISIPVLLQLVEVIMRFA